MLPSVRYLTATQGAKGLIREATPHDVARLSEIARKAYRPYVCRIGREPAPMIADFRKLVKQKKVWVLEAEDISGFIVMYPIDGSLQVDNVAVDPENHGRGYGGDLIAYAEAYGRAQGFDKTTLYTNAHMTENLSFYPSLGYREIGRRREDGFDRVYFSKQIAIQSLDA